MTPDTLKQLCERATPGPWECAWGATRQPIARAYSTKADTDGKAFGLYGAAMVPIRVDEDMELCAISRSALPALLKLWEAVKDYQTWYRNEPITGSDRHAERQASNAIQSALSELEAL